MRTRRVIYPAADLALDAAPCLLQERGRRLTRRQSLMTGGELFSPLEDRRLAKRARLHVSAQVEEVCTSTHPPEEGSGFDKLPNDLLVSILAILSSRADSPKDLINSVLTCKRFQELAWSPLVMSKASMGALRMRASQWCAAASTFLSKCAEAGNLEACFTLGMIKFYCLKERKVGLEMMARAAACSHAGALHALGVIQFNGSGGGRADKDLKAGVRLCARAASFQHVDAMRELGHCLQDGYGVPKNVIHGRRLILEANVIEAAAAAARCERSGSCLDFRDGVNPKSRPSHPLYRLIHTAGGGSFLSDFGCSVPPPTLHIAHDFLLGWFHLRPLGSGLRMCSHPNCGRPETRKHEFRRCSACGRVNYCSRACQALDWKLQHKLHCASSALWQNHTWNALIGLVGVNALYLDDFGDQ